MFYFLCVMITINMAFAQTKTTVVDRDSSDYIETRDGVKLVAKTAGNGPVCIFVHGGRGVWSKSFEEMGGRGLEKAACKLLLTAWYPLH